jgi:hypothetical protein
MTQVSARASAVGGAYSSKEPFEQLVNKYLEESELLHMSARPRRMLATLLYFFQVNFNDKKKKRICVFMQNLLFSTLVINQMRKSKAA